MRRLPSAHRPRRVGERDGDLGLAPRRDAPRPARSGEHALLAGTATASSAACRRLTACRACSVRCGVTTPHAIRPPPATSPPIASRARRSTGSQTGSKDRTSGATAQTSSHGTAQHRCRPQAGAIARSGSQISSTPRVPKTCSPGSSTTSSADCSICSLLTLVLPGPSTHLPNPPLLSTTNLPSCLGPDPAHDPPW
jgi:hypothetical protein